jgi:PAS domain S-box-containing protein
MKLYKEFLALLVIVMIIPFSILSVYSVKSIETKVEDETFLEVKSLEEKSEIIFENIEMQCSMLGKRIEDIENNPGNYKNLYKRSDFFYLPNGGYISVEPEKSQMWVPNTVRVTPKIKNTLGLLRNMDQFSEEMIKNPYIKGIEIHRSNEIAYTYPSRNLTDIIPQELTGFLPKDLADSPLKPILDLFLANLTLQKIKIEMRILYRFLPIINLVPGLHGIVDEVKQYLDEEVLPGNWSAKSTNRPFYVIATPSNNPEKKVVWSPVYLELAGRGWIVSCSAPLYDKEGNFFGVGSIDVDLNLLIRDLFDIKLGESGYVFLMNEKGNALTYPKRAVKDLNLPILKEEKGFFFTAQEAYTLLNLSLLDHPNKEFVDLVKGSLKGNPIQQKVKLGEEKYLILIPLEPLKWVIGGIVPSKEIIGPVRNTILITVGIAAVACAIASLWMGKRIAYSFTKISETSSKITKGDLNVRVDTKTPIKEFQSVSEDINQMVEALQERIKELRKAIGFFNEVLGMVSLGDLSSRVDTKVLKGEAAFLGEAINAVISLLESHTNEIKQREKELRDARDLYGNVLDKIAQKGDLSARVDVSKLTGKHEQIGGDINKMVDSLQAKIKEIHERETELKETRAYAEAIIANLADPLWVVDKEDNWILVNEVMKKLTGYTEKEMIGKKSQEQPLFNFFLKIPEGKERLEELSKKIKAKERVSGILIPWLTKNKKLLMMSCSGEPLKDAKGNRIGGVFIGKDMSVLERAGISASRALARKVEAQVGKNYELATLMFMSNATLIAGDSSLEILRGTVEGYNRRFNKNIGIKEGIVLTNMPREEWPSFLEFLLSIFYDCIGPTTFECSEGIKSIEDIVEKVKAKYGAK